MPVRVCSKMARGSWITVIAGVSGVTTRNVGFGVSRWMCLTLLVFFVGSFSVTVHAQSKHRIILDDLKSLKISGYPQELSPDGKWLAFTTKDGKQPSFTTQELWVVATQPQSVARKLGNGILPRWSQDGKRLAYYSDDSGSFQ